MAVSFSDRHRAEIARRINACRMAHRAFEAHWHACTECTGEWLCPAGKLLDDEADLRLRDVPHQAYRLVNEPRPAPVIAAPAAPANDDQTEPLWPVLVAVAVLVLAVLAVALIFWAPAIRAFWR